MIRILEEIIRDPEANATARCTAIRTLREFPQQPQDDVPAGLYSNDFEPRRSGRGTNTS
jgi:hypothetical protein